MKATLEFDLDNPDDEIAHLRCVKATDLALAIWEIERALVDADREWGSVDKLADEINIIISRYGIVTDDIIR